MRKLYIILSLLVALNSTNVQAQSMKEKLEAKYGWACEHTYNGQKWYSVQKDGKEGACDKNGKELIPPEYDDVSVDYDDKYIKAKRNGEIIIFNLSGKELFHGEFDDISWWQMKDDGYCEVKKNGKKGLINKNGKLVVPCEYKEIFVYVEDKYIRATQSGNSAIYNLNGDVLLHGDFDDIKSWWNMKNGYCEVKKNGKYGVVNREGKLIIPCEFDGISYYNAKEGLCGVAIKSKNGVYDVKNNKLVVPCQYGHVKYYYVHLGHGYVVINDEKKYGFVNNQAKEAVPCTYSYLRTQKTPYLIAAKGGNRPSDVSPSPQSDCEVENGQWGVLDLDGNEVVPFEYDYIMKVEDDVAVVCKGGKMKFEKSNSYVELGKTYTHYHSAYDYGNNSMGFYNIKTKKKTEIEFDGAQIGEGYIGCKNKQNKWGYLDALTMETVIPFEYDQISAFANGVAQVKKSGKSSFLTDPRKGTSLLLANGGGKSIKVDENIPQTDRIQTESFAFIIANENYAHMNGADYAINDGKVFKEYCMKTFGMPEKNVRYYEDATYGNFSNVIQRIKDIADVYEGDASIIIYYSGLGMTDATTKEKYLLPTDANAGALGVTGVSVSELMGTLNALKTKQTIVILDASFTGTDKSGQTLAQNRGVAIASKPVKTEGNTFLCLGSDDVVSAYSSKEYAHSLFTYALLDKIQDSKGKCSLNDAISHATNWVKRESLKLYNKVQKPVIISNEGLNLQNIKF